MADGLNRFARDNQTKIMCGYMLVAILLSREDTMTTMPTWMHLLFVAPLAMGGALLQNRRLRTILEPYRKGRGRTVTEKELDLELLRKGMLFRNMTDEEIRQAVGAMSPHRVRYPKRTAVAQDGDLFPEIGIILSGSLHLEHVDSNGNNNLLYVLNPGDAVGELNAVGRYRLHVSISTEEPTEILYLSVDQLLRKNLLTAPTQIRFLQNLTLAVAQKGQYLTRKLEDSVRRTMRDKVQEYLSAQYHKGGDKRTFSIPLNRQEMADFLFADRSALSFELCKMRDEGLLQFDRSRFELLVEMPITEDEPDPNDE